VISAVSFGSGFAGSSLAIKPERDPAMSHMTATIPQTSHRAKRLISICQIAGI